jgi:protein-tyrosine phosphatase
MSTIAPSTGGLAARLRGVVNGNHGTWRGLVRAGLAQGEYAVGRVDRFLRPPSQVQRLVFVCLGNINRSAFGDRLARSLGVHSCSIGLSTSTGAPATALARQTAPAFGVDLEPHRATDLSDYQHQPGDLLLAMEIRHAHRLAARGLPAGSVVLLGHWAAPHRIHLHDPHTLSPAYFRTCFTLINGAVHGLVRELADAGQPCTRP